jgi:cation diffusion facilitator CzcD-associated flavoprotein CzcO
MKKSDYKVAIIGSGFLGMNMAIQLIKEGITDFVILEASNDVGGVWRDNSYPGAACDIPSHLYSLKDAPNPYWSSLYSPRKEIYEYLQWVAKKFNLHKYIKFSSKATGTTYNKDDKNWTIGINNSSSITANLVIPALGPLAVPAYPNVKGIDIFEGIKVHTSQWNEQMEVAGKRIAVIGTGASSVQLVPELAKVAGKLYLFQRTASWVLPKLKGTYDAKRQKRFEKYPILMQLERERIFWRQEFLHFLFKNPGGFFSRQVKKFALSYLNRKIKDPELRKKLTPDFTIGCKRLLQTNDFYPSLNNPNVEVITDAITGITKDSLMTGDGREFKVDIIVFGTGFSPGDVAGLHIATKSNKSIMEVWNGVPKAYKGITTNDCPNMFFLLGPNTGLGHNSVIHMGESQAKYIINCIRFMEKNKVNALEVKKEAEDNYMKKVYKDLENSVWQKGGCASWYQNEQGVNFTLWPNSCTNYRKETSKVNFNDFIKS